MLSQLFGTDMSARLGGLLGTTDTGEVNHARVRAVLDEMTERLAAITKTAPTTINKKMLVSIILSTVHHQTPI